VNDGTPALKCLLWQLIWWSQPKTSPLSSKVSKARPSLLGYVDTLSGEHTEQEQLSHILNNKRNQNYKAIQISILEWCLKDHVTLKNGVMILKI